MDTDVPVAEMTVHGDMTVKDIIGWRECIVGEDSEIYPILVEVVR